MRKRVGREGVHQEWGFWLSRRTHTEDKKRNKILVRLR